MTHNDIAFNLSGHIQYTLSCPQPYKKIKIRIYDFHAACYHKINIYKAAAKITRGGYKKWQ